MATYYAPAELPTLQICYEDDLREQYGEKAGMDQDGVSFRQNPCCSEAQHHERVLAITPCVSVACGDEIAPPQASHGRQNCRKLANWDVTEEKRRFMQLQLETASTFDVGQGFVF